MSNIRFRYNNIKASVPTPRILNQYLNQPIKRLKAALGLVEANPMEGGPTTTIPVSLNKIEDKSFTLAGQEYDTYSFKAWTVLTGANTYVVDMGLLNVSKGLMLITKQSTNIAADDTAGIGGFTNGAIANTGTLVEDNAGSTTALATLAYINQDNTLTGVDDNYMFLIVANTGLITLDAEAYVDFEFVVEKGAEVELIKF